MILIVLSVFLCSDGDMGGHVDWLDRPGPVHGHVPGRESEFNVPYLRPVVQEAVGAWPGDWQDGVLVVTNGSGWTSRVSG